MRKINRLFMRMDEKEIFRLSSHRGNKSILLAVLGLLFCAFSSACQCKTLKDLPLNDDLKKVMMEAGATPMEQRFEVSRDTYKAYVESHPGDPLGHYLLGASYLNLGNYKAALEQFGSCLALEPDFADAHQLSASALAMSWDTDSNRTATDTITLARTAAEKAVELAPEREDFLVSAASIQDSAGGVDAAFSSFRKALDMEPLDVKARYQFGRILMKKKYFFAAARNISYALMLCVQGNRFSPMDRDDFLEMVSPAIAEARARIADSDKELENGRKLLAEGKTTLASDAFNNALALCGDNVAALVELGGIYSSIFHEENTALSYYVKAANADPFSVGALAAYCGALEADKPQDPDGAKLYTEQIDECKTRLSTLRSYAGLNGGIWYGDNDPKTLAIIGGGLLRMGWRDEAAVYLGEATLLSPDNEKAALLFKCATDPKCDPAALPR